VKNCQIELIAFGLYMKGRPSKIQSFGENKRTDGLAKKFGNILIVSLRAERGNLIKRERISFMTSFHFRRLPRSARNDTKDGQFYLQEEGQAPFSVGTVPFRLYFKKKRDCPPSSTEKGACPLFYFLFGPAQLFLDKVEVVSPGRGYEMKLVIAALDLDHIILHHQSPALAVECEEDLFS
jgi:hypothetical protein